MTIKAYLPIIAIAVFAVSCVPAKKVEELKENYAKSEEERKYLSGENQRLETLSTEQESELNKLRDEVTLLLDDTAQLGMSLRRKIKQYKKVNDLNNQLLKKQSENIESSAEENRKLLVELQSAKEDLQEKEDELLALEKELKKKENRLNKMSDDLADREAKVKELQQMIAQKDSAVMSLKDKVKAALLDFEGKGLTVEEKNGRIYVSLEAKLLFASGSTAINTEGKPALIDLAKVLEQQNDITVLVEGHTDTDEYRGTGTIKDNWDLSVMRATSVVKLMLGNSSLDPTRLTAAGRGQFVPVDPADTKVAKAKNRRIEIILTPNLDKLFEILEK